MHYSFVDYSKCDYSEPNGTLKHLFLSQGNVILLWLVLLSDSTYICNGSYYCFVDCIKISWCTKPDGTVEAPVLDPWEFYVCVVGIAHSS